MFNIICYPIEWSIANKLINWHYFWNKRVINPRNNCDSITRTNPSFAKRPVLRVTMGYIFLSRRAHAGRNNNAHRRVKMTAKTSRRLFLNPPPCPQCTLHRHYHEWRCRRTSFYLPTRPVRFCVSRARVRPCTRVYVQTGQKSVSHLYRLAPHRSEVYLAVDWHENPVEAFIMGGAVRLGEEKKCQSIRQLNATRETVPTRPTSH